MTLLLGFAIFLIYSTVQGFAMIPMLIVAAAKGADPAKFHDLVLNGLNVSLATVIGCPVMVLLCGLVAWSRRTMTVADYLAVRPVSWVSTIAWSLLAGGVALGLSLLNDLLGREVPEFVARTFESAGYMPLFWCGIGFCAPVAEEILFRGFLYPGLAVSRLRTAGAVVVTTILFVALHLGQYDWPDLLQLGILGLLFGLGRARTASVVTAIAMHVSINLTALILISA